MKFQEIERLSWFYRNYKILYQAYQYNYFIYFFDKIPKRFHYFLLHTPQYKFVYYDFVINNKFHKETDDLYKKAITFNFNKIRKEIDKYVIKNIYKLNFQFKITTLNSIALMFVKNKNEFERFKVIKNDFLFNNTNVLLENKLDNITRNNSAILDFRYKQFIPSEKDILKEFNTEIYKINVDHGKYNKFLTYFVALSWFLLKKKNKHIKRLISNFLRQSGINLSKNFLTELLFLNFLEDILVFNIDEELFFEHKKDILKMGLCYDKRIENLFCFSLIFGYDHLLEYINKKISNLMFECIC
ncbi:MAG: hypothetical protein N2505_00250 [Endomicrobia bacterium]|nr:hypothetical protein [Endomicrobiia bacterium]